MIKIQNLTKTMSHRLLFENLSFAIEKTGLYAITGPSGIGKTTLLRIIMGLESADSGTITGTENLRFSPVFPEDRLIPTKTALENAAFAKDDKQKAASLLERLGLSENLHKYPDELSTGMKRRVSLARALVYEGDILILDEPFSGLDEKNKENMLDILFEYSKKLPVLLVSHDTSLLQKSGIFHIAL